MSYTQQERERIIALAAVMQTVYCVHSIATHGRADDDDVRCLLQSLLVFEPDTTEEIYGGLTNLRTGLEQLRRQLVERKTKDEVIQIQYAVQLLRLERKLTKFAEMQGLLSREIEQMPQQVEYYGNILDDEVVSRFADIYKKTISNITPYIQVHGEAHYLTVPARANLIRALLLAGIRAAILWYQKGGRRRHFIFQAKKLEEVTQDLQSTI